MSRPFRSDRLARLALWAGIVAAAAWTADPLLDELRTSAPSPTAPILPPDLVPDGWLAPGRWVLPDDPAAPEPVRPFAFDRSAPPDMTGLPPAPPGVSVAAVRVGPDGRASAVLLGPADPAAVAAGWAAAGWAVDARTADPLPEYRLRRGGDAAIAWAVGRPAGFLLVTTARPD